MSYDTSTLAVELLVPVITVLITFYMLTVATEHPLLFVSILLIGVTIAVLCIYDSKSTWSLLVYVCTWYFWIFYSYGYFSSGIFWQPSLSEEAQLSASPVQLAEGNVAPHSHDIFSSLITSDPSKIPTGYTALNMGVSIFFLLVMLFTFNDRWISRPKLLSCVAAVLFVDVIPFADNNMFNRNLFTVLRCVMYVSIHVVNNIRYRSYKHKGTEAMLRGFLQIQYILFGYFYVILAGFVIQLMLVILSIKWAPTHRHEPSQEPHHSPFEQHSPVHTGSQLVSRHNGRSDQPPPQYNTSPFEPPPNESPGQWDNFVNGEKQHMQSMEEYAHFDPHG